MQSADYKKISRLMNDQKYYQCIRVINELIKENKQNPRLFHLLGLCQLRIAKSTKNNETYLLALNSFKTGLSIFPQKIASLIRCAEISSKLGNKEEALLFYDQVLSINPELEFYRGHGIKDPEIVLMRQLGYFDEALERINLLLSKNGYNDERIKRKIHILDKMGKTEEAIELIDQFLSTSGFDKPLFLIKVKLIRRHWGEKETLEFLEDSLRDFPEGFILNEIKTVGRRFLSEGKSDVALDIFEMLSTKGIDCSNNIAECFMNMERYKEAIDIYQKNQHFDYSIVRNLTHCYIKIKKDSAALNIVSNYLKKNPSNCYVLSTKAFILVKMNRINEAISIYKTVSIKSPSWNVFYQLYKIYFEKQEQTLANNYLQEAILLNPNRDILWYEKGMLSIDLNQLEIAEISFKRSISLNNNFVQSYIGLAKILMKMDKWDEALEKLNSAMEITPNDPFIAKEIGYVSAKKENSIEINELRNYYQNAIDNKIEQIHNIEEQLLEEKSLSDIVKSILPEVSENSERIQQEFLTFYLSEENELTKSKIVDDFCYNLWKMLDEKLKNRKEEVQIIEQSIKQTCEFSHKLENESLCAIATGDFLIQSYKYNPNLDYSPVVIEYCKALECELYTKLFKKIRMHLRLYSHKPLEDILKEENKNKKIKSLCSFFNGDKELTLGEITFILIFVNSKSERSKSILLRVIKDFIETKTQNPNLFLSKGGFNSRIMEIVNYYRNPAAHVKILNSDDAILCREKVLGCLNDFTKCF